jgi:hypothetical protein
VLSFEFLIENRLLLEQQKSNTKTNEIMTRNLFNVFVFEIKNLVSLKIKFLL